MKIQKRNVTFRIGPRLKNLIEKIAQEENRSFSNQLNVALEEWVDIKSKLHPQFIKDIKESLASGKPEAVWKG